MVEAAQELDGVSFAQRGRHLRKQVPDFLRVVGEERCGDPGE
jgi:hypothetical protein